MTQKSDAKHKTLQPLQLDKNHMNLEKKKKRTKDNSDKKTPNLQKQYCSLTQFTGENPHEPDAKHQTLQPSQLDKNQINLEQT